MSTQAYAKAHRNDPGRTGKQARLALTFSRYRGGKRKSRTSRRSSRR